MLARLVSLSRFSRFALPLSLLIAAPALGCGGTVAAQEQPASAESATTRAPVAQGAHGMVKLMGDAFGDVPLTPSQRAQIEQMASDAEARHAEAQAARKDLMLTLASQVEAGRIDRAALQPKIDAIAAAMQKAQPADRASLEQLHALLTPEQRAAFADALQSRFHGGMKAMHAGHDKHPMKEWADDLKLTDEQRAQLKTIFQQRFEAAREAGREAHHGGDHPGAEAHERGAKLLAAFKQDRFVMDEVAPAADIREHAAKMADHVLGTAEAALPVLTPEQRALAAQKLREHADRPDHEGWL
jgi:Spy/CpxP family protein refolding chaperone